MSWSVNDITLLGHVGRDPDVRQTQNGTKVAHFSVATNRRVGSANEKPEERTDWHRVTVWGRDAVFAGERVRKGSRVYIAGRLEYDTYERDGVTIPTAEVHARNLILVSSPKEVAEEAVEMAEAEVAA